MMKIIHVYIGSIAIRNWQINDYEKKMLIGTQEDFCDVVFKEFPTKEDHILFYNEEFSKLQSNTTKQLERYKVKYESIFNSIFDELKKHDKVKVFIAAGGFFSSICTLILLNNLKNIEVNATFLSIDLSGQNFMINRLKRDCAILNLVSISSLKDELLSDYLLRLDECIIRQIRK